MNEIDPHKDEKLPPLDVFEREWISELREKDADLAQTEDAFVDRVMDRHRGNAYDSAPVIGRIGGRALPFAAAAALVIAALCGWLLWNPGEDTAAPGSGDVAQQPTGVNKSQPTNAPRVAVADSVDIELGGMISDTKSNMARSLESVAGVSNALRDVSASLKFPSPGKFINKENNPLYRVLPLEDATPRTDNLQSRV